MRRPDLLILIAIWMFITAGIALIGIAAVSLFALPDINNDIGAAFGLSLALIVLVIYLGISIAGGIGLLAGKNWGRILAIIHAILALFAVPFGTVIGALTLVYLFREDVRAYFER